MEFKVVVISSVLALSFLFTITGTNAKSDHSGPQSDFCPRMCTCDMVDSLKRADCSHENLINAYTDVPTSVEILDLSINKISSIGNDDFKEYTHLVKLFLSENSIQTISLYAFSSLRELHILDLSHNRLEQLNEDLFESNELLIELNLSNNNFMTMQNQPFLNSPSIMNLDLSACKIPQLYDSLFGYMPKLTTLDLSQNLMITLPKEPFVPLKRLRIIELYENQWQCESSSVRATINWMKKRIDSIQIENCFLNPYKTKAKFEKMELDPRFDNHDREEVSIDQVWGPTTTESYLSLLKEKSCAYNAEQDAESHKTCENFIECQKRFSELYYTYVSATQQKAEIRSNNSRLIATVMLVGVFIGVLFGSFTTYSVVYLVGKCRRSSLEPQPKSTRELRREFRERNHFEHTRLNESPTPQRANRQTVSSISSQDQSQIYCNHENTRQFLVNLFSKRQPRYVRSNSQISNLHNRYMPPTPIRDRVHMPAPRSPAAHSSNSFIWQQTPVTQPTNSNDHEQEPILRANDESRQSSEQSTWNYYGISEPRQSPTVSVYEAIVPQLDSADPISTAARETPPPPYVDCTVQSNDRSDIL
ncbi:leucine-rich repeat-containing G-protein coupled receptor 5-like [Ochlerotatus camptorhynchus]|uniref:leucine-rich repeat-containing G-protein coupled receptor 5-like n=1 Tax=Ochlerotatus camptorhynchus TaxID=644619 RepID=UPI0031DC1D09